jgi:hypothetical protein
VKNSVFLLQLQEKICEELLRPFYRCVDVFQEVIRDSDQPESCVHLVWNSEFVTLTLYSLQPHKYCIMCTGEQNFVFLGNNILQEYDYWNHWLWTVVLSKQYSLQSFFFINTTYDRADYDVFIMHIYAKLYTWAFHISL